VTKDYLLFKKIAASCSSYIISRYFITLCVRGLSESDRLLAATTLSFDIAALELFLPLVTGSSIVLATRDEAVDGRRLTRLLSESGATVMQATPGTWRMLVDAGWPGNDLWSERSPGSNNDVES